MGSTLSFFSNSIRWALGNRWVVEKETWRIQGSICSRDSYESLKVSSGIRERKFGECFNCSYYCVQCCGANIGPDATHRPHWSCSKVGGWIGICTSHIGVHNSEGTSDSAPFHFKPEFPKKWPSVVIKAAAIWCFLLHFARRNQVQAWQKVCRGICHKVWIVVCVSHG